MKTIENLASEISDEIIQIAKDIVNLADSVIDNLTHELLPFDEQLKNKKMVQNLLSIREEIVDRSLEESDEPPHELASFVSHKLDHVLLVIKSMGKTPEITGETRSALLSGYIKFESQINKLNTLAHLSHPVFNTWLKHKCHISDTLWAKSSDLWESYSQHWTQWSTNASESDREKIPVDRKQFAAALKSLGVKPNVKNVSGKTTRVYEGIACR